MREAAARESRIRGIIAVGGRERLCKGRNVRRATYIEPTLVIVKHHKVWKFNFEFQFKRNQVENSVSGQGRSKCLVSNISCLGQPTDIHTHKTPQIKLLSPPIIPIPIPLSSTS